MIIINISRDKGVAYALAVMKMYQYVQFMIIGIMVIEFRFFNMNKKKNYNTAFLLISHTIIIQHIFTSF